MPLWWAQPAMVCHTTLLKRVKRAKTVKARMGVSMTTDVEGIEEPKKVEIILLVHNKRGMRCVWMFTWKDGQVVSRGKAFYEEGTHTGLIMQSKN
jgi:hypothetical protein